MARLKFCPIHDRAHLAGGRDLLGRAFAGASGLLDVQPRGTGDLEMS